MSLGAVVPPLLKRSGALVPLLHPRATSYAEHHLVYLETRHTECDHGDPTAPLHAWVAEGLRGHCSAEEQEAHRDHLGRITTILHRLEPGSRDVVLHWMSAPIQKPGHATCGLYAATTAVFRALGGDPALLAVRLAPAEGPMELVEAWSTLLRTPTALHRPGLSLRPLQAQGFLPAAVPQLPPISAETIPCLHCDEARTEQAPSSAPSHSAPRKTARRTSISQRPAAPTPPPALELSRPTAIATTSTPARAHS